MFLILSVSLMHSSRAEPALCHDSGKHKPEVRTGDVTEPGSDMMAFRTNASAVLREEKKSNTLTFSAAIFGAAIQALTPRGFSH